MTFRLCGVLVKNRGLAPSSHESDRSKAVLRRCLSPCFHLGVCGCLVWCLADVAPAQTPRRPAQTPPRGNASQPDVNPRHERAKMEAQEASRQGDHQHAIDLTSAVIRENPRDDLAYYIRAGARVELGRSRREARLIRDGIVDARRALDMKGTRTAIYYLPYLAGMTALSQVENDPEHAEIALSVVEKVLALPNLSNEERANLVYQRGTTRITRQNYGEAAADFAEAVRLSPRHLGAYLAGADAYAQAGRHDRALERYGQAVRTFDDSPLVYNNRGSYLQSRGDLAGAIADFTKAIELNKDFSVSYVNRGFARMRHGDLTGAEADLSDALRLNPDQNAVYSLRGTARLSQGKMQDALADFETLARRDPRNPLAQVDLGFARFFNGDHAGALESFNQAVTLGPQARLVQPWRLLAMQLADRPEAERQALAESLQKPASERDWIDHLVAYVSGESDSDDLLAAVDAGNEPLRKQQLCEAHFFIGQKLAQAGQEQEAETHFQQSLETGSRHLSAYRGAQFALGKTP